jgi:hypothetical protein
LFPFRAFIRTEPNVSNRSQELKESIRIANRSSIVKVFVLDFIQVNQFL